MPTNNNNSQTRVLLHSYTNKCGTIATDDKTIVYAMGHGPSDAKRATLPMSQRVLCRVRHAGTNNNHSKQASCLEQHGVAISLYLKKETSTRSSKGRDCVSGTRLGQTPSYNLNNACSQSRSQACMIAGLFFLQGMDDELCRVGLRCLSGSSDKPRSSW